MSKVVSKQWMQAYNAGLNRALVYFGYGFSLGIVFMVMLLFFKLPPFK